MGFLRASYKYFLVFGSFSSEETARTLISASGLSSV